LDLLSLCPHRTPSYFVARTATPNKINCYFDNTGGLILQTCLFRMAQFGRICCCGNVSGYDTATPAGGPRGVPGLLVNNQVKMEGFVVSSVLHIEPAQIINHNFTLSN
jgi:NADPH-dependent curcumin reductase CurA